MNINYIIQFISESFLGFYPILIKLTTLSVELNTFIRLVTYFLISSLFANWSIVSAIGLTKILSLSIVNIIHILTSYYAHQNLNTSLGAPLFYTYPFINLVLGILYLNEQISLSKFIFLGPILFSIYNLYSSNKEDNVHKQNVYKGIPLMIISAFTESLLYILIKTTELGNNPWNSLFITHALAAFLFGFYYLYKNNINEIKDNLHNGNKKEFIYIILANVIIGFFGYSLRFYSIPRVESTIFSIISYTGILATIFYSAIFKLDTITIEKIGWIITLIISLIGMKLI